VTVTENLTARELDVLALVAAGKRSRDVAGQLGVSEATVKRHLYNVYRKLNVANRVGATMWYVEHHRTAGGRTPGASSRPR
jgi:DNA-binding NarL/FixJ family response regulator